MLVWIFSAILIACQAAIVVFPLAAGTAIRFNALPLVAFALLWLNWIVFRDRGGFFSVVLWIAFAVTALGALNPTVFAVLSFADGEKREATVVYGDAATPKLVAMVYHPGASGFPLAVDTMVAERLARAGMRVSLDTANSGLVIDTRKIAVLGISSPVYTGSIRLPVLSFLSKADLKGVKCFVVLTGWVASSEIEARDLEKIKRLIEARGGIYLGGKKFSSLSAPNRDAINAFVDGIEARF